MTEKEREIITKIAEIAESMKWNEDRVKERLNSIKYDEDKLQVHRDTINELQTEYDALKCELLMIE